jgi:hypothetical protein
MKREAKNDTQGQMQFLAKKGASLAKEAPPSSASGARMNPTLKTFSRALGSVLNTKFEIVRREVPRLGADYLEQVIEKVEKAQIALEQLHMVLTQEEV